MARSEKLEGPERMSHRRNAFTLVELLVVIAIIGVLVALLLPAVNAAREAARRIQCMNQVRQMGLAILNHENAMGMFPSGGVEPWPLLEDYVTAGRPNQADQQGLSWAFQILPFLEEGAVHNLVTTEAIANTPISIYFCPSRRAPVIVPRSVTGGGQDAWLMDYAAMQAMPVPPEITEQMFNNLMRPSNQGVPEACRVQFPIWGTTTANDFLPRPRAQLGPSYLGFKGVIVRSSYLVRNQQVVHADLGYDRVTTSRRIRDGMSKTGVVAEKRVRLRNYAAEFDPADDRGWSDGWDFDTVRLAVCPPLPDSRDLVPGRDVRFGSAHVGGFHCVFADGAVHFLNYSLDPFMLNRVAHRADGAVVELP